MRLQQEIEALVTDLAHVSELVSQAAAYSLIDIGRPAGPALIRALRQSKQEEQRSLAAFVLGQIKALEAVPALIEALEIEAHDRPVLVLTNQAYDSLLEIGTPEALTAAEAYQQKVNRLYGPEEADRT